MEVDAKKGISPNNMLQSHILTHLRKFQRQDSHPFQTSLVISVQYYEEVKRIIIKDIEGLEIANWVIM